MESKQPTYTIQSQFGRNDNVILYIGKVMLGSVPKLVIIVSI